MAGEMVSTVTAQLHESDRQKTLYADQTKHMASSHEAAMRRIAELEHTKELGDQLATHLAQQGDGLTNNQVDRGRGTEAERGRPQPPPGGTHPSLQCLSR